MLSQSHAQPSLKIPEQQTPQKMQKDIIRQLVCKIIKNWVPKHEETYFRKSHLKSYTTDIQNGSSPITHFFLEWKVRLNDLTAGDNSYKKHSDFAPDGGLVFVGCLGFAYLLDEVVCAVVDFVPLLG